MDNNQNIQYNYDDNDGVSITLKSVWEFVKLAAVRTALCVLAMIIVATGTVVVWDRLQTRERVASASVEFVHSGVDLGLLPDGSLFSPSFLVAPWVLNEAVIRLNFGGRINDISELRNHFTVDPVLSREYRELRERAERGDASAIAELADTVFFPSRFNVRFSNIQQLGLNRTDATRLLNEVINVAINSFIDSHFSVRPLSENVFVDNTGVFSFAEHYTRFRAELTSISINLNARQSQSPNFRSSDGLSFADLSARMTALVNTEMARYNNFVLTNAVAIDREMEYGRINSAIAFVESEIARLIIEQGALRSLINLIEPDSWHIIDVPGDTPIIIYTWPAIRIQRLDELDVINRNLGLREQELAMLESIQDAFAPPHSGNSPDADTIAAATQLLRNASQAAINFVILTNRIFAEYNRLRADGDHVRIVQPIAHTVLVDRSFMTYILIYGAMIVVGIAAGAAVTQFKIIKSKRNKTEDESAVESAAIENE